MRQWLNITADEYHALPAYGSSAIRRFVLNRAEFWAVDVARIKQKTDSDSMRLGRDFHAAMESGDAWREWKRLPVTVEDDNIRVAVNFALRKNAKPLEIGAPLNLEWVAHQQYLAEHRKQAEESGTPYIDGRAVPMVAACQDNPAVRELLAIKPELTSEVACTLKHSSGIDLKALCDRVMPDGLIDFKTTMRTTPQGFLKDAFRKFGYQYQAGLYSLVTAKPRFWFISITTSPPYIANVYEVPQRALAEYRDRVAGHAEEIAQCLRMNVFDDKTVDGMPVSFCPEMWGTVIPFVEDFNQIGAIEWED